MRYVPMPDSQVLQSDEVEPVKAQEENRGAQNRKGQKNGSAHRNWAKLGQKARPHKESHNGGELAVQRLGLKAAKLGHGTSFKEKKKEQSKTGINATKAKLTTSLKQRKLHRATKVKPHMNNATETYDKNADISYQDRPPLGQAGNSAVDMKSSERNTKSHAKTAASAIKGQDSVSMTDELGHLIKKHRSHSAPHKARVVVKIRARGQGTKQRVSNTAVGRPGKPASREEMAHNRNSKTSLHLKERILNLIRHYGRPNTMGRAAGRASHARKLLRNQARVSNENRLGPGVKSKSIFPMAKRHRKRKTGLISTKGGLQIGNGRVSHSAKIGSPARVPTKSYYNGAFIWKNAGFSSSGENEISGGKPEQEQTFEITDLIQSGTHDTRENESGKSWLSGEYNSGYHQEESEEFGGESAYNFSYNHRGEEGRVELPDTRSAGSGAGFDSGIWTPLDSAVSGDRGMATPPSNNEQLESDQGHAHELTSALWAEKLNEPSSADHVDSGSRDSQETSAWSSGLPQRNDDVTGEGSGGYESGHEQNQNSFGVNSSVEEEISQISSSGQYVRKRGQDAVTEGVSGEAASAGNILQLSLLQHDSDSTSFGGESEPNSGDASSGHQTEVPSGDYGNGYAATSVEHQKSIFLSRLSERLRSRTESHAGVLTPKGTGQNSFATARATAKGSDGQRHWQERLQGRQGHSEGANTKDDWYDIERDEQREKDDNNEGIHTASTAYDTYSGADKEALRGSSGEPSNERFRNPKGASKKSRARDSNSIHRERMEKVKLHGVMTDDFGRQEIDLGHQGSSTSSASAGLVANSNWTSNDETVQSFSERTGRDSAAEYASSGRSWIHKAKESRANLSSVFSALGSSHEQRGQEDDDWSGDDDDVSSLGLVSSSDNEYVDDDVNDDDEDGPFL